MSEIKSNGVLNIANLVADLVLGDIYEHLPLARIPRHGNVLGLGTTTSADNGETVFVHQPGERETDIFKCCAHSGGTVPILPDDGNDHFPFVCFTDDQTGKGVPADLSQIQASPDWGLAEWVAAAIAQLDQPAPIYGLRVKTRWTRLVITVASKLCMAQTRRNPTAAAAARVDESIYDSLQHYYLAADDGALPPHMNYLGDHLNWECCGFYDTQPELGRITVPDADAHLHIHGLDAARLHGGHLHHEHPASSLLEITELHLYPLHHINYLSCDIAVSAVSFAAGELTFSIHNQGTMDVDNLGVDVVINDEYSSRRHLRVPWLSAQQSEDFTLNLDLPPGEHELQIVADPNQNIIEPEHLQNNNRYSGRIIAAG